MKKRNAVALIRHPEGSGEVGLDNAQQMLRAQAKLAGWGHLTQYLLEDRSYFLLAGGELGPALKTLGTGDIAITPSLSHLAPDAKTLRGGLPRILGADVVLWVMDLGGDVRPHLPGLTEGWSWAEPLEEQLAAERTERKAAEAKWASLFESFTTDFAAAWVRVNGIPSHGIAMPPLPEEVLEAFPVEPLEPTPAPDERDLSVVGQAIRQARLAAGLTQAELAEMIGANASTVSRIESGDNTGPAMEAALRAVAPGLLPSEELTALGVEPQVFMLFRAKQALLAGPPEPEPSEGVLEAAA